MFRSFFIVRSYFTVVRVWLPQPSDFCSGYYESPDARPPTAGVADRWPQDPGRPMADQLEHLTGARLSAGQFSDMLGRHAS